MTVYASTGASPLHQTRRISRHEVDLEIDLAAGRERPERGHRQRVGNNQYRERVARGLVDGERDAVDRDRALRRDEADEISGNTEGEPRHVGQILTRGQGRDPVGVAGDDVSAELVADPERALEIDAPAVAPLPDRGHSQGLRRGVDREPAAVAVPAASDDGEAHAAAGDRGADVDRVGIVAAGDLEPRKSLRPRL